MMGAMEHDEDEFSEDDGALGSEMIDLLRDADESHLIDPWDYDSYSVRELKRRGFIQAVRIKDIFGKVVTKFAITEAGKMALANGR